MRLYMLREADVFLFFFTQTRATPLHWSAANGHEEICEVLKENGANVNAVTEVRSQRVIFERSFL